MQDPSRLSLAPTLPRFGDSLSRLRLLEHEFRTLSQAAGFTEISLPLLHPFERFRSRRSGQMPLTPGPRIVDHEGTEWALRSDMTAFAAQFLLEHQAELPLPARVAYSGKVFSTVPRTAPRGRGHGEAPGALETYEFGAEIVGEGEISADLEIVRLAKSCARAFGYQRLTFVVSDARIARTLYAALENPRPAGESTAAHVCEDVETLSEALQGLDLGRLDALFAARPDLAAACENALAKTPCREFIARARAENPEHGFLFNPFLTRPQSFYSGLTFEIYAESASAPGAVFWAGGGGRYDTLFSHYGRDLPAVGFMLRDPQSLASPRCASPLRIALPKGRLVRSALAAFAEVGIVPELSPDDTRRLILPSRCGNYEFLLVKNGDVAAYLEDGVADVALVGSDVLDEHPAATFVRPLTMNFGSCRLCLAGRPERKEEFVRLRRPRVATKYVRLARKSLGRRGVPGEIVALQGSVELASVIDLADAIVDLVETGSTLRENGLVVYEELGNTRVQLATTRSFYYQQDTLWKSWRDVWNARGLLAMSGTTSLTGGTVSI